MEIKINNLNAAQTCVDQNDAMYRLQTRKNKRIYLLILVGFGFCAFGLFDKPVLSGLSIFFDFGVIFIGIAIMTILSMSTAKKNFKHDVHLLAYKYSQGDNNVQIKINDSYILLKSAELTKEMKWSYFRNYAIFENYIFIISSSLYDSIAIDKKLLTENEYSELVSFLNTKLTIKQY